MKKIIIYTLCLLVGFTFQTAFAQTKVHQKTKVKAVPEIYYLTPSSTFQKPGGIELHLTPLVINDKYEVWLAGPTNALPAIPGKKSESLAGIDGNPLIILSDSSSEHRMRDPLILYSIVKFTVKNNERTYHMIEIARFSDIYNASLMEVYEKMFTDVLAQMSNK